MAYVQNWCLQYSLDPYTRITYMLPVASYSCEIHWEAISRWLKFWWFTMPALY